MNRDQEVRLAAFGWLKQQTALHSEVLPWFLLVRGFDYTGERIPLVSQQGIFKPRLLDYPLSIRSSPSGPYADSFGPGALRYKYRGTDPHHADNVGLRRAMQDRVPLVYFFGLTAGRYLAVWPVFIVGDDPASVTFLVEVDDQGSALLADADSQWVAEDTTARRKYVTAAMRRRLHQEAFRERVIRAYRTQCALCSLRHEELLDAAHIVADSEEGEPWIRNGVSLCKLHHAAFDAFFLAVRPDYVVEVRRDILEESDGPMLVHGLQQLNGSRLLLPRRAAEWPDPQLLEQRWRRFSAMSRQE